MRSNTRIFDGFPFFNELDMLELRLEVLDPVVDFFVIGEATRTHQGAAKPLYYKENRARFARWAHKIIHVVVDDLERLPKSVDTWDREWMQRDGMARGYDAAHDRDLVMHSDVDEIPDPKTLRRIKDGRDAGTEKGDVFIFWQKMYEFRFDLRRDTEKWPGPRMMTGKAFRASRLRLRDFRFKIKPVHRNYWKWPDPFRDWMWRLRNHGILGIWTQPRWIEDGGWHFSNMGDETFLKTKVASYAHDEHNTEDLVGTGRLQKMIDEGFNLYGNRLVRVRIEDENMPEALMADRARWAHLPGVWEAEGATNEERDHA